MSHDQAVERIANRNALLREYDRLTGAGALFWTLDAKQVGKGALVGWEQVLAASVDHVRFWPFDEALADLLNPGIVVIAETYPAAGYGNLGLRVVKSNRASRAKTAPAIEMWASTNGVALEQDLLGQLHGESDDDFDAAIGALGIIDVLRGNHAEGWPTSDEVRRVEGWIVGA